MPEFTVHLWREGAVHMSDCLGMFFPTIEAAHDAAIDEIVRVACIHETERVEGLDWAHSYRVKRYDSDIDEGYFVTERLYPVGQ
jgi:hypothetical protein